MKLMLWKTFRTVLVCLLSAGVLNFSETSFALSQRKEFIFPNDKLYGTAFTVNGKWDNASKEDTAHAIEEMPSRSYYVDAQIAPKVRTKADFGASVDLKSLPGTFYNYLKKTLPGKKIKVKIFVPEGSISGSNVIPNKVRFGLKSVKGEQWVEFCGKENWKSIREEGVYELAIDVPSESVVTESGETFYPEGIRTVFLNLYFTEGVEYSSTILFAISDLEVEGVDMADRDLPWELTKDGYVQSDAFLPSFPAGSTYIEDAGSRARLGFSPQRQKSGMPEKELGSFSEGCFLSVPVVIPKELKGAIGKVKVSAKEASGKILSREKAFDESDPQGKMFLTIALGRLKDPEEAAQELDLYLEIESRTEHTADMMPFIVEPVRIVRGGLIPFDKKWALRDVQGSQKTDAIPVVPGDGYKTASGLSCSALGDDLYQTIVTVPLKGGIVFSSAFYRAELIRVFDKPEDMTDKHVQLLMTPLTDTTDLWQQPYRARVGLLDKNDNVMFGTNVSLSEGVAHVAYLDVSITNPIPKGFVMPNFDPKNVKAVLIDFESSPAPVELDNIRVALSDLSISSMESPPHSSLQKIDFSVYKREPESWQITKIISGAKDLEFGINYPFPTIKVPTDVLEVPQVYPTVGKKLTDPDHFGFSSKITREQTLKDLTIFAQDDIKIVRIFTLGDLAGVFAWDHDNWGIEGFTPEGEKLLKKMSGMKIDEKTKFLNKYERTLFGEDKDVIPGLNRYTLGDFKALLDILEQVEKDTGKRVTVIISLFDFLLGDGISRQGPYLKYMVGEYPQAVTDPVVRTKVQAVIWKLMKDLSSDARFSKYISMVEIFNEPGNACVLSTKEYFNDLVNFAGCGLYLLKDSIGPCVPVGIGFRSWPRDLRFWKPVAEGIDILTIHYWESLESYNINTPGLWPLGMPAKELWSLLGSEKGDRITGMSEISLPVNFGKDLKEIQDAGYDFCLVWSYSGHDGFKAKPLLPGMEKYQAENNK